jgi:PAS domain S-box-containing protein
MKVYNSILVVDDTPESLQVLTETLRSEGYTVRPANSGELALASIAAQPPDLILLDIRMPGMDGFELCRRLKADEATRKIPVIFQTAATDLSDRLEGLRLGAVDYISKPFQREELLARVKTHLELARLHEDLEELVKERTAQLEEEIAERRRAEENLRESRNFIRNILDSVDEGFIVVDRNYRILSANRAFCAMVKSTEEQVSGRLCYELSHASHQPCFEAGGDCPVRHTFETGRPWAVAHVHEDSTGAKSYVELKSYPIMDDSNSVVSVIETINDVTENHRLEEQLQQAQKLESIGQLAGGIAHDFNNMLAVILGRTQLMMRKISQQDPLYTSIQEIHKAAGRSADLTRQLLGFARKQVITPQTIELNEALEGLLKMLRSLIGENIALVWIPDSAPLSIRIDPMQLDQILTNLCANARDAIGSAGRITIETHRVRFDTRYCDNHVECLPGEYALVSVRDTGQGIDKETLPRIFEPFFTTKEVGRGTGLGLATVYGIVKQNDGFINVDSEPEHGTTFKIYLPIQPAENTTADTSDGISQPVRGDETILLVEDEPGLLSVAQQMLEDCGYQVLTASGPHEALRIAGQPATKIDLLITDVVMPGMNGYELMKRLTAASPQLKSVFMSGYSSDVIARHGILETGVHFIEKPFSLEALANMARKALKAQP